MVLNEGIHQRTQGCEECKKEGTHWVALRLCLVCGHVGCCDSSIGLHWTKHHRETAHLVTMALPDKPWKWCHADTAYACYRMTNSLQGTYFILCEAQCFQLPYVFLGLPVLYLI
ncbi:MAG: UBP-type zinc finger domain-containing protein [Nitrosopumilus sp.]|nr:UBP-type zinc finger domain-containing protein [Nitrosopumilus sp.]